MIAEQMSLMSYPNKAGYKRGGTSQESAAKINPRVKTLRERCLEALKEAPRTADEVAWYLGESILSVRPRLSELVALGEIEETDERHQNQSGVMATVWRVAA